jgi:hypothetical protein
VATTCAPDPGISSPLLSASFAGFTLSQRAIAPIKGFV